MNARAKVQRLSWFLRLHAYIEQLETVCCLRTVRNVEEFVDAGE